MNGRIAVLLRHGDYHQKPGVPSAHQPFPLTGKGCRQAAEAAGLLMDMARDKGWAVNPVIHCSNLLRAWQTAEIIGENTDLFERQIGHDDLAERGVGSAANLTVAEIEKSLADDPRFDAPPKDWKSNSHYCLPLQGAESLIQAGARVATRIGEILRAVEGGTQPVMTVFVGHGAAFRHAAYHLGVLAFEDIARLSMYHAKPVALADGGDAPWHHIAGEWKIRAEAVENRNLD
ncbi:histidine phosphatase family protein [Aestuariispira insulae]|uniref:2,3-bisphosphoglycerate-dependent phosphoglycerate mutase n=1 Tax=Aestuariispira insulae TaxID=1461337 RepID=A0A3D9H8J8_9PROT|nr:histidine phosphatase family protein [Aestuariispira insulae]RED45805.1 2,3-bisphosphoglycerate-dependent phosphoglycerate mutase [Aestuariispira insulae]